MPSQKIRPIYSISLVILDIFMIVAAFYVAYRLRVIIPWPAELVASIPIANYAGLLLAQVLGVTLSLFFFRLYYLPRSESRVDQIYSVFVAVTLGALIAVASSATLKLR